MKAAAIKVELHIGGSQSLKEKRAVLRPVIDGLRKSMSVSVAEIGRQDTWQRSEVGIAVVARDMSELERMIQQTKRHFDRQHTCEMVGFEVTYMEGPDG